MKLDQSRLPALVWLDDVRDNVVEVDYVKGTGGCYNSNRIYVTNMISVENTAYRIIYYDTLKELLPEEFI